MKALNPKQETKGKRKTPMVGRTIDGNIMNVGLGNVRPGTYFMKTLLYYLWENPQKTNIFANPQNANDPRTLCAK